MTHAMRRILSLLLAALLLAGGCLAESAPEGVLGVVNGQTVPLTDAQIEFDYYAGMYESYGLADEIETLRGQIADYYVQYYVLLDAARQMGLDDFSQEELDGFAEQAQTQYDAMLAD